MRIAIFLLLVGFLQTQATDSYSQNTKLSISVSNTELVKVLDKIENQSEFYFLYNEKLIDATRKVSIEAKEEGIETVLKNLFSGTDVEYSIIDRKIILSPTYLSETQQPVKKIAGKVIDQAGIPIPGASVVVKGTSIGVSTSKDGNFSLSLPSDAKVLVFSFVGMKAQEFTIEGKTTINVTLADDAIGLEDVVVVGYGTQKKVNLTGAVEVIENKELADRPSPTVSQLLQGLSPSLGFAINNDGGFQPGATMDITIRGMGSLNGGQPYVLIDGFPGDLNTLNPNNVESISVLKDAAASAIYGARAPYGVILITTKSGTRDKKISVTYSGTVSLNTAQPLPKSLDSYTWARVQNEAGDNQGGHPISNATIDRIIAYQAEDWDYLKKSMPNWPAGATIFGAFPESTVWNNANLNYANNDWWDIYFGSSVNQKHDLSLTGGTKNSSYYFSAGHVDQSGVINYGTDTYARNNLLGKFEINITDWWNFSWETRFSKSNRVKPSMTREGDYSMMYRSISRFYPITPVTDGFGHYVTESHIPTFEDAGNDYTDETDFWNNFKMELKPAKGWKINADYAYNTNTNIESDIEKTVMKWAIDESRYAMGETVPNFIEKWHSSTRYWTSNIYSSYNLNINNIHNFGIMAGMQFEKGEYNSMHGYKENLIFQDVPSFQTATGTSILSESLTHRATEGYFARFNYNYKEKYLLEANSRYDGTYVFREGKRWGLFPSFSLGWNVNQEPFWKDVEKYVNTLKLRGSWGQLGNQNVSPYSDLELIPLQTSKLDWIFNSGSTRPIGYTSAPGMVNRNLTWETATSKNIGLNMSFFDRKLTADVDLFERLTENMVGPSEAKPGVLGASVPKDNNSALRTRGWELALNWKQKFEGGFSYFVNLSLSDYTSIVTKYFNPTGSLSSWYVGREVGELWGYTVNDLFRTQSELDNYTSTVNLNQLGTTWRTGDLKYEDTNKDGKVGNGSNTVNDHGDISKIGNTEAHYQYGVNAGMSYKGFDFSMLWRGVGKKDQYYDRYSNIYWGFTSGWWESTIQPRNLDYFRDTPGTKYSGLYEGDANINTDAYWPRPYQNGTQEAKNKNNPNTRYLQDASYLRLQNIQLGYSLPQRIISKLNLQKLRIAISGENLITFSKLPDGIDPAATIGWAGGFFSGPTVGRLTYGADRIFSFTLSATY